jgi:hypothetical protein
MELFAQIYRKRSWGVVVLATLTGCFALHSGSGETLLPEVGATSSPPAAGTGAARHKTAMLFMTSRDADAILGFPSTAKGNVAPAVEIAGDKTGLYEPVALAVDPGSGNIYAANDSGSAIFIFPKGANGNVAPQTLGGSKVPIQATEGIAVDSRGEIYVSDYKANAIYVFAAGASGNTAPIRTITGSKTRLNGPVGMSFDSKGNLYVANPYDFVLPIEEFAKDADGNVAPIEVLRGKHTKIVHDFGNVSIDGHDRIVVACEDSILIFAAGAHGNVKPQAIIKGKATKIDDTYSLGTDADSNIYTADINFKKKTSSVLVFAANATGNEAPLRVLGGSRTQIDDAHYPAFY